MPVVVRIGIHLPADTATDAETGSVQRARPGARRSAGWFCPRSPSRSRGSRARADGHGSTSAPVERPAAVLAVGCAWSDDPESRSGRPLQRPRGRGPLQPVAEVRHTSYLHHSSRWPTPRLPATRGGHAGRSALAHVEMVGVPGSCSPQHRMRFTSRPTAPGLGWHRAGRRDRQRHSPRQDGGAPRRGRRGASSPAPSSTAAARCRGRRASVVTDRLLLRALDDRG